VFLPVRFLMRDLESPDFAWGILDLRHASVLYPATHKSGIHGLPHLHAITCVALNAVCTGTSAVASPAVPGQLEQVASVNTVQRAACFPHVTSHTLVLLSARQNEDNQLASGCFWLRRQGVARSERGSKAPGGPVDGN
jgi:hypothetical protein